MSAVSPSIRRFIRCTSGLGLVESAITLPLMMLLLLGIIDFGLAFSAQATASQSMRDAARYLATLPGGAACSTWAQTNAKNLAVYGNISGSGSALVTGWLPDGGTDNNVTVTMDCSSSCPASVQISAAIPFAILFTPSFLPFSTGTLPLSAQHLQRPTPYVGDTSGC